MTLPTDVPTFGPEARFGGILLIEKDGLMEILRSLGIDREFDIMLAASEGHGVDALKEMIEELASLHPGVTIYLLRDFDIDGLLLAAAMTGRDTKSWSWSVTPNVVDLGVHYDDIAAYGILGESVSGEDDRIPLLEELGLEAEAIAYLVAKQWRAASGRRNRRGAIVTHWSGRRAELNGLTAMAFAQYVRDKLTEAGVKKMIPDDEMLEQAYRRADRIHQLNELIEQKAEELEEGEVQIPEDLRERVEEYLTDNALASWDDAVAEIAEDA